MAKIKRECGNTQPELERFRALAASLRNAVAACRRATDRMTQLACLERVSEIGEEMRTLASEHQRELELIREKLNVMETENGEWG